MKFYDCASAPSPRRIRMFLAEKGLEIETIQVDLSVREQLNPEFEALNPWRTVPVLQLDDGTCISECAACSRYLEAAHPEPPLMGVDPVEQGTIAMWDHRIEIDGFYAGAEHLRNQAERMKGRALTGAASFDQIPEMVERAKKRIGLFYDFLDTRLGESEYVAADHFTVADITGIVAVDFALRQKLEIPESLTNLLRWHAMISARPSAQL